MAHMILYAKYPMFIFLTLLFYKYILSTFYEVNFFKKKQSNNTFRQLVVLKGGHTPRMREQ